MSTTIYPFLRKFISKNLPSWCKPFIIFFFLSTSLSSQAQVQKLDAAFNLLYQNSGREFRRDANAIVPALLSLKPLPIKEDFAGRNSGVFYDCIIQTDNIELLVESGVMVRSVLPGFVTAGITANQVAQLVTEPSIKRIMNPVVDSLFNDIAVAESGAALLHAGVLNNTPYTGKGVIVAIYDTGIDFMHPDFRDPKDPSKSRILYIWDQTISAALPNEKTPINFPYGTEYSQEQINQAINGTRTNYVRQEDINGHGTHVAAIAAGNGAGLPSFKHKGMAPEADLIIIKGGNGTFEESMIIDGIKYLDSLAVVLNRPIVLNMSLGGQYGAHDGSRLYEKAIDNFTTSGEGKVAVIAAGNSNGTNIHIDKRIPSLGGKEDITINVPSNKGGADVFAFYATLQEAASGFSIQVQSPGGDMISLSIPAEGIGSSDAFIGDSLWLYTQGGIDPLNDKTFFYVYLSRGVRNGAAAGNPVGNWKITTTNNHTSKSREVHGWLYYRSSSYAGTYIVDGNSDFLVASPGNATSAITVGSYTGRLSWNTTHDGTERVFSFPTQKDSIAVSSSRGPRVDFFLKPEITATGHGVISALSGMAAPPGVALIYPGTYSVKSGTSMASPVVAGAAALLLQAKPQAMAAEIKNVLINNTTNDFFTNRFTATPNATYGYGKLDVYKAATALSGCDTEQRIVQKNDSSHYNGNVGGLGLSNSKVAILFSAEVDGELGGIFLHTTANVTDLAIEIRNNDNGNPGNVLLGKKEIAVADGNLTKSSWNYVALHELRVGLSNAQDYFVVMYPLNKEEEWELKYDSINNTNKTRLNNGTGWNSIPYNLRVRALEYTNQQLTQNNLANTNTEGVTDVESSQLFQANCEAINAVVPSGDNPVRGSITSKVRIEDVVSTHKGQPYVQRYYEITPVNNPSTATATITLYFTQQEFTVYNSHPGAIKKLPVNGNDESGKANVKVEKISGLGDGATDWENGVSTIIIPRPENIVWNEKQERWEITFDVEGFSTFIVHANEEQALPIKIEYFTAKKESTRHLLEWKANCNDDIAEFEVQRSADGINYQTINTIQTNSGNCSNAQQFTDVLPLQGFNYYRIKVNEKYSGSAFYTKYLIVENTNKLSNAVVYPNLINRAQSVTVDYKNNGSGYLFLFDESGRQLYKQFIKQGQQEVVYKIQKSGMYFYTIVSENGTTQGYGKIVVQ